MFYFLFISQMSDLFVLLSKKDEIKSKLPKLIPQVHAAFTDNELALLEWKVSFIYYIYLFFFLLLFLNQLVFEPAQGDFWLSVSLVYDKFPDFTQRECSWWRLVIENGYPAALKQLDHDAGFAELKDVYTELRTTMDNEVKSSTTL